MRFDFDFSGLFQFVGVAFVVGLAAVVALVVLVVLWLCGVEPAGWMAWVGGGYALAVLVACYVVARIMGD